MTTVHSNTPRDALRRLENMVSMAGLNYPINAIRQQSPRRCTWWSNSTASPAGARKIVSIEEITGMEGDKICLQEIFAFRQVGIDRQGNALGQFESCRRASAPAQPPGRRGRELSAGIFRAAGPAICCKGIGAQHGT